MHGFSTAVLYVWVTQFCSIKIFDVFSEANCFNASVPDPVVFPIAWLTLAEHWKANSAVQPRFLWMLGIPSICLHSHTPPPPSPEQNLLEIAESFY